MSAFTPLLIKIYRARKAATATGGKRTVEELIPGAPFVGRLGRRSPEKQRQEVAPGVATVEQTRILFLPLDARVKKGDIVVIDACAATGHEDLRALIQNARPTPLHLQCDLETGAQQQDTPGR